MMYKLHMGFVGKLRPLELTSVITVEKKSHQQKNIDGFANFHFLAPQLPQYIESCN